MNTNDASLTAAFHRQTPSPIANPGATEIPDLKSMLDVAIKAISYVLDHTIEFTKSDSPCRPALAILQEWREIAGGLVLHDDFVAKNEQSFAFSDGKGTASVRAVHRGNVWSAATNDHFTSSVLCDLALELECRSRNVKES
jgi:hypothetical protein